MATIPHYLRLKPNTASDLKARECLIETQTHHQIRFKETATFNKFTKIFNDVSQLDLYKETIQDLTLDLLNHDKDSAFFTLGPSNSGKSYSIYGDDSSPGVAIYALNEIFTEIGSNFADYKVLKRYFGDSFLVSSNAIKNTNKGEFGLSISVFELYNDRIRDLSLDSSKTVNQSLDIVTDVKDGKTKPNKIRQIYVANVNEAKLVLHKSIKRRAVSATNINEKSSRSHLFIYFNLHKVIGKNLVRTARMTIADLAGSERTKTAKTEGKEFKEGNYTNQSLTELGRCLSMMKSKKFDRSILRTSKLTRLLLTDLFGNFTQNKIKILLTLDPYSDLTTILHAIRYIQPVSKVTISSERNSVEAADNIVFSQMAEEVKLLRSLNQSLETEKEKAEQRLVEFEIELRNELNEAYELKFKELEYSHMKAINEIKSSNQDSIDERLELLSQDYESKIVSLKDEYTKRINELEKSHLDKIIELEKDYAARSAEVEKLQTEKIIHLEKLQSEKIIELETLQANKLIDLEKSQSEKIAEIENTHAETVAAISKTHTETVNNIEQSYIDKIAQIEKSQAHSMEEIDQLNESNILEFKRLESQKLKSLEKTHQAELESVIKRYESQLQKQLEDFTRSKGLGSELEAEILIVKSQLREAEDSKLTLHENLTKSEGKIVSFEQKLKSLEEDFEKSKKKIVKTEEDLAKAQQALKKSGHDFLDLLKAKTQSENQFNDLQKAKIKSEHELISDITKEKRENEQLKKQIEELQKGLNKTTSLEERVEKLTSELDKFKNKRKSDTFDDIEDTKSSNKRNKTEKSQFLEEGLAKMSPIKINSTSISPIKIDTASLSPIKLSVRSLSPTRLSRFEREASSPSKHKATFQSPFKLKSPAKAKSVTKPKVSFESPSKVQIIEPKVSPLKHKDNLQSPSKVLRELNFDHTLPSPKVKDKVKSPHRKKKILKRSTIDEDSF